MQDHYGFGKYLAHLASAAGLFTALAVLAGLLGLLIKWIDSWAQDPLLTKVLTTVKYGILGLDVTLLAIVLLISSGRFVKHLFRSTP